MTRVFLLRLVSATAIALLISFLMTLRPVQAASLREVVTTRSDLVTLGDLVDDAGSLANTPVFRSPDAGLEGVLPATQAADVVRAAGIDVDEPIFANIRVRRLSKIYSAEQIRSLLLPALAEHMTVSMDDLDLSIGDALEPIAIDASSDEPVSISSLTVRPGGSFSAVVAVDIGASNKLLTISGTATETMAVPVPLRPIARGEVLRSEDLAMARIDRRRIPSTAILDLASAVGKAARRPLRTGEAFAGIDIESPKVVLRNQLVTILFERPGMTLTARGRALADAAVGETVAVMNEQSHRTIQGVVSSAGTVSVEPTAQRILTQ